MVSRMAAAAPAGVRRSARRPGAFIYIAAPWGSQGGGMYKVADYLVQSQATPAPPQLLGQSRSELRFPRAHRLVAEHKAADEEHLGQVAQGELVAQAPEHHERDDVAGILGPVQQAAGAFIELLAAGAAAEAAVALGRALGPLRHRLRPARYAPQSHPPSHEGRPYGEAGPRQPRAVARDLTEPTGP